MSSTRAEFSDEELARRDGASVEQTHSRGQAIPGHSARLEDIGVMDEGEMDAGQWTNPEDAKLPDESAVLRPFGWRMLVMPVRPKMKSDGGILLPFTYQEGKEYLNYVGRIVALGSLCFRHDKYKRMGLTENETPKRGDWIVYPVYSYQRLDFKGTKLIILNDDSFLGIVPEGVSPWDFKLERQVSPT